MMIIYYESVSFDLLNALAFLPVSVADFAIGVCVGPFAMLETIFPLSIELAPVSPSQNNTQMKLRGISWMRYNSKYAMNSQSTYHVMTPWPSFLSFLKLPS